MLSRFSTAALAATLSLVGSAAMAGAGDYAFEAVNPEMKKGDEVTLAVRLTNKQTGKPVSDAVIFKTRVDMTPDGMAEMSRRSRRCRRRSLASTPSRPTCRWPAAIRSRSPRKCRASRRPSPARWSSRPRSEPSGGRPMSLFHSHGRALLGARLHAMKTLRLLTTLALGAGLALGAYWYSNGGRWPASCRRNHGRGSRGPDAALLPRSGRRAALVGRSEEGRPRAGLPSGLRRRSSGLRAGEVEATRGFLAQDQILPQPDGPSRHLAGAEEGLHGDGLHRGLRRRRYRRRLGQTVARQNPAHGREIRTGSAAA